MWPARRGTILRAAALVPRIVPVTFTERCSSTSAGEMSHTYPGRRTPAMFMSTSTGPNAASAVRERLVPRALAAHVELAEPHPRRIPPSLRRALFERRLVDVGRHHAMALPESTPVRCRPIPLAHPVSTITSVIPLAPARSRYRTLGVPNSRSPNENVGAIPETRSTPRAPTSRPCWGSRGSGWDGRRFPSPGSWRCTGRAPAPACCRSG